MLDSSHLHRRITGSNCVRQGVSALALLLPLWFALLAYAQLNEAPRPQAKTLVYSRAWGDDPAPPVFANFRSWTERYVASHGAGTTSKRASPSEISEGVELARQRRAGMEQLIKSDPERAIAMTVPAAIRRSLPAEVVRELEIRVCGIGNFSVRAALPAIGGPPVEPIEKFVQLGRENYRAFVYGRRADQKTKRGIPLHGVAIDTVLALAEGSVRELEAGEAPNPAKPVVNIPSGAPGMAPALGEVGDKIYGFATREHLLKAEAKLEDAEGGTGPYPKRPAARVLDLTQDPPQMEKDSALGPDGWTTGNKNVLIIRVDFSDLPGDPRRGPTIYTASYVQNLSDTQIKPYYLASSYGLTSLTNTATTQLYRMPQTAEFYATNTANDQLHDDAEDAASANYVLGNYDRIIVLFSSLSGIPGSHITYGGLGNINGPNVWVNGEFDFRVVAHELGHTYGLYHAGLWQVTDGNPISPSGTNDQYGDDFDTMGANFDNVPITDFNPYYKSILGWISGSQIQTVTTNGTYRINRFDHSASSGLLAVRVAKDSGRTYWIGCRRNFTGNASMQHGAYIIWGYNGTVSGSQSDLLDMTTPGDDDQDAALAIGSTFTDSAANISFLPVGEGGSGASQYIDVQVTFGNTNYTITTSSSPAAGGTTTGSGTFPAGSVRTVTATPNGGYTFVSWTENGSTVSTSTSYTFTLNSNRNLVANFSSTPNYTVTTSSSPAAGGTTTGGGTFPGGSVRTVTATANGGYSFVNWTENGSTVSTSASYTFTLNSNRNLVAHFSSSPTPTPTPCGGGANVIADGGFEDGGVPSTIWINPQTSTNFGTPLCDEATCGTGGGAAPPRTGVIWAWFGGIAAPETATLGQNVIIPSGGSATLNFWMRIGSVSSPFTDVLNVRVDGAIVQSYPEPSVAEGDYTMRAISLNAFANGATHNIEFEYIGPSADTGSYVVDDVSLIAGGGCGTPTPTPTATPCGGTVFSQTFDGVTAPALPAGWVATNPVSGDGILWATSTTNPYTSPNAAFIPDQTAVSDKVLDTPGIAISSASAQLSFRNNFDTEFSEGTYWDGGVLEVSSPNINGGAFTDVTDQAVGGSFVSGGYTGLIDSTANCPLAGRMAWSGNSGGYISTVVNLGPNVNGRTIKLRFRMATDEAVGAPGWRIDTLSVVNGCATPTILGNISTRLRVETANNVLIGGFIVTGTQPKRVILRAIGPSLSAIFPGTLANPVLELRNSSGGLIASNDNWRSDQEAEIIGTGIPPNSDLESAIVATLPANNSAYTATVRGSNNGTGIGVVEAYDLNQTVNSKLANISTRGLVQTGDNVMIGGLIVLGQSPLRVIVRAIGPSLSVPGALGDPTLELRDGNGGLIDSNDNWRSDHEAEIIATGVPPTNDLESAIVRNLTPGNYTAIVLGVGNTTGVALVEAYGLN